MNREILFRGKRVDNGEWIYGYLIFSEDYIFDYSERIDIPYVIPIDNFNLKDYREYRVDENTIGQYTGLKDKNGKKIFDGDICKGNQYSDKDNLFVIKYGKYKTKDWKDKYISNTYQFGWYAEFIESKEQVHLVIPNGIEVIGNIFDEKE